MDALDEQKYMKAKKNEQNNIFKCQDVKRNNYRYSFSEVNLPEMAIDCSLKSSCEH